MDVAEFFAGIGLVRMGLEQAGFRVIWANDISAVKLRMYSNQFGDDRYVLRDIHQISGSDVPVVALATASFPCIDLSLAGNRDGLRVGAHSSTFWEFVRILREQGNRRPPAVMIENVVGFLSSHSGQDLRMAISALNELGYICDILIIDANHFVPQSRPRLFIIGSQQRAAAPWPSESSEARPPKVIEFVVRNSDLVFQFPALPPLPHALHSLGQVIEPLGKDDSLWWEGQAQAAFECGLGPIHVRRLAAMIEKPVLSWATAYRRTRSQGPVWEVREDSLSGCLRAVSGGSSRQAVVEAGQGEWRVRWMTSREYARLQGAPSYPIAGVGENQALHAFGDAVCVPVVSWLATHYLASMVGSVGQAEQAVGKGDLVHA